MNEQWERIVLATGPDGSQHEQIVANGIGVMRLMHDGSPEGNANAALIAAAPEMLVMLTKAAELLKIVSDGEDGHLAMIGTDYFHEVAERLIAKAKGS